MLKSLRSGLGFRVAMTLTVLAAFCLVAPPAVMAFGHGEKTAHCLSQADRMDHGGPRPSAGKMPSGGHMASGGLDHANHGKVPAKHDSGCCGLFCVSAIAPQSPANVELSLAPTVLAPPIEKLSFGGVPEQPDRPPIFSLSV